MAKINNQTDQLRGGWPWPADVRDQLVHKSQLVLPKRFRREGDPKNPPLASELLVRWLKTDGGVTSTRLSQPPAVLRLIAEVQARAQRGPLMRRVLARAAKSRSALAKLLGGTDLSRFPEARREAVRQDLEREEAMLKLLEGLGRELDEIARCQVPRAQEER